jgi:hypothetical protein
MRPPELPVDSCPSPYQLRQELEAGAGGESRWDDQRPSMSGKTDESEPVLSDEWLNDPGRGGSLHDSTQNDEEPEPPQADEFLVPTAAPIQPKRNWLERWLFPDSAGQDKRSGARKPAPGLVAHFWTGGPPKSQPVRDISATGMYVMTEERWYLGTQIRITLTKSLEEGPRAERSITVLATAVRWGNDGVGLEFVRTPTGKPRRFEPKLSEGADGEQLGQFVEQFGATSDSGPRNSVTRKR